VNLFTVEALSGTDTHGSWTATSPSAPPGAQPAVAWAASLQLLLERLDDHALLARVVDVPFGRMTVDEFLAASVFDWLAHTWDAATAGGIEAHLDDSSCEYAMAAMADHEAFFRGSGRVGAVVATPPGSSPWVRFLASVGRDPSQGRAG
jgi:hypothetical protein